MLFKRIKLIFGAGLLLLSLTVCAQPDKKTGISVIEFYLPKLADIEQKKREKRSENPYFTIVAEGGSAERASELAEEYRVHIEMLLPSPEPTPEQ